MRRVLVQRFFWMSLPTTGLVIGIISTILYVSLTIWCLKDIFDIKSEIYATQGNFKERDVQVELFLLRQSLMRLYAALVGYLLGIFCSVLLIVGTKKASYKVFIPWLFFSGIGTVFLLFKFLNFLSRSKYGEGFGTLITLILHVYIWIAICSLYAAIKLGEISVEYANA